MTHWIRTGLLIFLILSDRGAAFAAARASGGKATGSKASGGKASGARSPGAKAPAPKPRAKARLEYLEITLLRSAEREMEAIPHHRLRFIEQPI